MIAIRNLHELKEFKLYEILNVVEMPKSTYEYHLKKLSEPDKYQKVKDEIRTIRKKHKDFGYRRVYAKLLKKGFTIGKNTVQRLMEEMGLQVTSYSRKSRKYNSYRGEVGTIAPNRLNRRFMSSIPYQKIVTDTTELKYYIRDNKGNIQGKKLYLDPYMDLFNSEIVSFKISPQPNKETMLEGLEMAIEATNDCQWRRTFHSDQGWAYQMKEYGGLLEENKIFQSMSRKGNCLDNSPMENFFSILKQEMYYGYTYRSYEELEAAIINHIDYYNNERIKEKLGWMSPVEYREHLLAVTV